MKKRILILTALVITFTINAQVTLPPSGANQKSIVTQYIGPLVNVTVTYSSPDVTATNGQDRKGKIWGALVPWGMPPNFFGTANELPWRGGANENTVIKFSHDVLVQGQKLAAGVYSIHFIPKENAPWTLIFNSEHNAWGSHFYKQENDALRVAVTPKTSEFHEWLTYEFIERNPASTVCALSWENLKIPFSIEVENMNDLIIANLEQELSSAIGFIWNTWDDAANFCLTNNTHLEKGLQWAEYAVAGSGVGQANFTTLSTKASLLEALGKSEEAEVVLEQAIEHPSTTHFQIYAVGRRMLVQGKKEAALKLFQRSYDKFKGVWPTAVGLVRGFSATGEYAKALKYARIALIQAPDEANKTNLTQFIEKLKKNEDIN